MRYFMIGLKGLGLGSRRDAAEPPMPRQPLKESKLRMAALLFATLTVLGCSATGRMLGANSSVGNGLVSSYAELDNNGTPKALGIVFPASVLEGLPTSRSDGHHCFDRNKDGKIDPETECFAAHEWVIPLPSEAARRSDIPFKWVGLNWNQQGHMPPKVYDLPHFDVHFYIEPIEKVFAIEPGLCGPEFANCDQYDIATKPLPSNYMHPDFKNVGVVAPAMGNHLIDPTSPEFMGIKFTRTWIYGVYDGRVTFYEEMVTLDYLQSKPIKCFPIKSPAAVGVRGYYPSQSCIRYLGQTNEYTISIEGFALREASAPEPIRAEH